MLNTFKTVSEPETTQIPPEPDTAHPRKSAYAAMGDLQERFSIAGICTDQVWAWIKDQNGVDSRALFTGKQWATVAAQLQSARREPQMFKALLDGIPDEYFRIHVFPDDPAVCIGRPRDTRKHHIAAEWGDFQAISTDNQCGITVTQGKRTTYFSPKKTHPIAPARQTKPVIALNTNARGEVLAAWGDVMEVSA